MRWPQLAACLVIAPAAVSCSSSHGPTAATSSAASTGTTGGGAGGEGFAVWQNMGLDPSRMHDDAETCGAAGDTHSAAIKCADNFPRWGALFE